ncbi:hypothetical protein [Bdellovibrio sp. NC01]|uniref:hypothetical protein n=1 Tax=Bdellovibrio sp. NC01 TaxID=2220073 RepID=UPI00115A398E|nr:hypothetical protein [Bdellovibrio sp. NC01]QDK37010.1 hypothetical protein DOE51_05080 [Bdellovibrio sp. NC01]
MSFKEIYNRILLGLSTTALVVVISGATSNIIPFSKMMTSDAPPTRSLQSLSLNLKALAPQCKVKVLNKTFELPRCQDVSSQNQNRLH